MDQIIFISETDKLVNSVPRTIPIFQNLILGKLGEQFVTKSPAAFEKIQFVSYEIVDNTEYFAKKIRDDESSATFRAELETDDWNDLYMRDIIRNEVTANDPRLQ